MPIRWFFLLSLAAAASCFFAGAASAWDYPAARTVDQTDDYFGAAVADPYRWLEDDRSDETAAWVQAENELTASYLERIPFREDIRREMTRRFDYVKYSVPFKKKDRIFFFKNDGLQNQPVLYMSEEDGKNAEPLLDPNALSEDGTAALGACAVSKDGKYLAYTVSRAGSDWQEAYVLNIDTKETLADRVEWIKFSDLAWFRDGFYYSRYPAPEEGKDFVAKNEYHQVWYHRLGTAQSDDRLLWLDKEHPQRTCSASTDEDETVLFLSEGESTYGNRLLALDLTRADAEFVELYPAFDAESFPLGVLNGMYYVLTDYLAPLRRVVAVDPKNPAPENWADVIPESENLISDAAIVGGRLAVVYLKDAAEEGYLYSADGNETGRLDTPTLGVLGLSGSRNESTLYYSFTSFVHPAEIFKLDLETGQTERVFDRAISLNPDDYDTKRVWYTSKDGTRAPLFLTCKKGTAADGENPTLLYGYGGFNINMTPMFKPEWTVFLDRGGVLAVAVLRGGGEYGAAWHEAGTKERKQNVFDDFIAAAEYLIREKWTSPGHLAILGRSNGGLLVGAAMTQRPDLFKAAVPGVGVLDMLRYHKFTIGWAWAADYGTSEESREMFDALYAYSPLHNIKSGVKYPATLILTGDHDDRVVPAHSFKFAAALQAALAGTEDARPALIRIDTNAGHGRGKPTSMQIDENTDIFSFILEQTQRR
ncbi:MAG: S9 family peptidase [Thermoguttaceae bacterium]|nr:S9 family peptidase [Thermoguttaceae bacterium]